MVIRWPLGLKLSYWLSFWVGLLDRKGRLRVQLGDVGNSSFRVDPFTAAVTPTVAEESKLLHQITASRLANGHLVLTMDKWLDAGPLDIDPKNPMDVRDRDGKGGEVLTVSVSSPRLYGVAMASV